MKSFIIAALLTISTAHAFVSDVPGYVVKPRIGIIISTPQFTAAEIREGITQETRDALDKVIQKIEVSENPFAELKELRTIKTANAAFNTFFSNLGEFAQEIENKIAAKDLSTIQPYIETLHQHLKELEIKAHAAGGDEQIPLATKTKLTQLREAVDKAIAKKASLLQQESQTLVNQGNPQEALNMSQLAAKFLSQLKDLNQGTRDLYNKAVETAKDILAPGKTYQPIPSRTNQ